MEGVTVYQFPSSVEGLFEDVDPDELDIEESSGYNKTDKEITINFEGVCPDKDNDGDGIATE